MYSRWRGGTTTFGPLGRIVITVLLVLVHVSLRKLLGFGGIIFIGVGYLAWAVLSIWILTHVWKRDRVG